MRLLASIYSRSPARSLPWQPREMVLSWLGGRSKMTRYAIVAAWVELRCEPRWWTLTALFPTSGCRTPAIIGHILG